MHIADEILREWDADMPTSGHLFYQQFGPGRMLAHIAVRLSWKKVICWRERSLGAPGYLAISDYETPAGEDRFHRIRDARCLKKDVILKSLLASCECFHERWIYSLWGWNCEHWARLVATGDPVSFQTRGPIAVTIGHFRNPDALRVLSDSMLGCARLNSAGLEQKSDFKTEVRQPPNQAVQPTPGSVTPRASSPTSK
jgi:hypothetical protein